MIRLTKQQVLQMHMELINATGGSYGVRDETLLDAALAAPFISLMAQICTLRSNRKPHVLDTA